jgi:DNA invertase Pin-like site-specific DNA recombinase
MAARGAGSADRPKLAEAIIRGAKLVIAKLDRLARNTTATLEH